MKKRARLVVGADETEVQAAHRRGHLHARLTELVNEHGADDVLWMLGVVLEDMELVVPEAVTKGTERDRG